MNCDDIQRLLPEYLVPESRDPEVDWERVEVHLEVCPACAEECEYTGLVIELIRSNSDLFTDRDGQAMIRNAETPLSRPRMTVDEGWEDLKRRVPELAQLERRQECLKLLRRVGSAAAIAASVALITTLGWIFLSNSKFENRLVVSKPIQPIAFAELITSSGRQPLALGQPVTTTDQRQEILLGGIHRVVMNTGTSATFGSATIGEKVRYNLQLARGEMYVEVIPGHLFTVKTPNASLIITGTKFDVLCDPGQTKLTLVKGSVRFANANGNWADVTAGFTSTITGNATPTVPQKENALAATAWARDVALTNALANAQQDIDDDLLSSLRDSWQIPAPDLDKLAYDIWTKDKRDWFTRQFPWIFKIDRAFREGGIETDYVTLLMISGDIWQFHYPCKLSQPIPAFELANVQRIGNNYDVQGERLLEIVGSDDTQIAEGPDELVKTTTPGERYYQAFMRWHSDITKTRLEGISSNDLALYTLRATDYIATTHTAAYLWIQTHPDLAEALLSDSTYFFDGWQGLSIGMSTQPSWAQYLRQQIATIHAARFAAERLLTTPSQRDCQSRPMAAGDVVSSLVNDFVLRSTKAGDAVMR